MLSFTLAVIRDQKPWYASIEREGIYMTVKEGVLLHVGTGFCVCIEAAGQHSYEQICRRDLSSNRIMNIDRAAGPVNFEHVSRFT